MKTPTNLSEITSEWLTYILAQEEHIQCSKVSGIKARIIGEGNNFLSTVVHVLLEYDRQERNAPNSLVVKLEPTSPRLRNITAETHAFEREIRFYQEVAPFAPIRLPRCYYAAIDPPNYLLVIEDLTFAVSGDQVAGLHAEQVLETARLMGRLQGKYWNNDSLANLTWMPTTNRRFWSNFDSLWDSFLENYDGLLEKSSRQLGDKLRGKTKWLEDEIESRPRTIVHSDLRADNILVGPPGTPESIIILDWQLAIRSIGAFDVARMMGGSELPDERHGHQLDVLHAWFDGICESDIDYSWEDALYDLRLGALITFCWSVQFYNEYANSQGRTKKLIQCMSERTFDSAVEMDAGRVLPTN